MTTSENTGTSAGEQIKLDRKTAIQLSSIVEYIKDSLQRYEDIVAQKIPREYPQIQFNLGALKSGMLCGLPRRVYRQTSHFEGRLQFIQDRRLRKNCAYALQLLDFYVWLANRFHLVLAFKLHFKLCTWLLASVIEAILQDILSGKVGKNAHFKQKVEYLLKHQIVNEKLASQLNDLWGFRNKAAHIFLVEDTELEKYGYMDINKAMDVWHSLEASLYEAVYRGLI